MKTAMENVAIRMQRIVTQIAAMLCIAGPEMRSIATISTAFLRCSFVLRHLMSTLRVCDK
jgi:hypothetical protein